MESESKFLAHTKDDIPVYFDEQSSHAETHLQSHPKLLGAVIECIPKIVVNADLAREEFELSYVIGTSDLVATTTNDEIVYALRPHRTKYSRFVKNREPAPTRYIVIDIRKKSKKSDGSFYLYTCFIGRLTPSFPGGDFLPEQSVEFWSKHALVWGTQEVIPGTITKQCPWR
jgi:hypothetical protein